MKSHGPVSGQVHRLASLPLWLILGMIGGNALIAHAAVNITGQYTGVAHPTNGNDVAFNATLSQSGTTVTGTMSVPALQCLVSLHVSGTVNGTTLTGSFSDAMSTIDISGTVSGDQINGTYNIPVSPCANGSGTFTLTKVASAATATPTSTATSIPSPTPTPGSTPCVGDCNDDRQVTVDDLLTLVNIALGSAPPSACPNGVPSDAEVDIALILQAVSNALNGCSLAQAATTCPVGYHKVCHGGSGRGGGYRSICSCVVNPPPVCVTAWGTQISAGTTVTLYDTYTVYAPDTCAAHGMTVSCDSNGVLSPPNATGYPVCNVIYDGAGD